MPMFDFICEVCGAERREWRVDKVPRFCGRECQKKGVYHSRPRKYPISQEAHEAIRKAYAANTGNGEISALAGVLRLPRWKVTKYAISQGWIARTTKEPDWTEKELDILERSAHRSPERIQIHLKRAGYRRSVTGIVLKRKRMRYLKNLNGQSVRSLAECFGIDVHTVLRWIRLGQLKALKRELHRTPQQGGDIYLIRDGWVRDFVLSNLEEVDLRKVDKYWFVDLIAGRLEEREENIGQDTN